MPPWGSARWEAEKSWRLQTLQWRATGKKFNSRDTTAHWHCGMHGEVGIAHTLHLRAWEKRHVVEGTGKSLMTSPQRADPWREQVLSTDSVADSPVAAW